MTPAVLDATQLRSRGYSLEPLQPERWPVALEALQRSYPRTPAAWCRQVSRDCWTYRPTMIVVPSVC
jgi:hypothetical protein